VRCLVHAGAITSIVDGACGYAALTKAPLDCEVVTVEFKINLVRSAIGVPLLAIGKVQTSDKLLTVRTVERLLSATLVGWFGSFADENSCNECKLKSELRHITRSEQFQHRHLIFPAAPANDSIPQPMRAKNHGHEKLFSAAVLAPDIHRLIPAPG